MFIAACQRPAKLRRSGMCFFVSCISRVLHEPGIVHGAPNGAARSVAADPCEMQLGQPHSD